MSPRVVLGCGSKEYKACWDLSHSGGKERTVETAEIGCMTDVGNRPALRGWGEPGVSRPMHSVSRVW